jgi:integrase
VGLKSKPEEGERRRKRRSPRGLGSIRKKSNGAWEIRVTVGGESVSRSTAPGATKSEAEALRKELLRADPNRLARPKSSLVVEDAVDAFLADAARRTSRATVDQYGSLLRQHLASRFGALLISKLKPAHLRSLLAETRQRRKARGESAEPMSPRSRQALYIALQQLQKHALAEKWIAAPFLDGVEKPRVDRRAEARVRVWTSEEAKTFLATARQKTPQVYDLFVFMLELGPRIGECLALRWRFVDLAEGTVTIAATLDKHGDLGPPKTQASYRTLHLSPRLLRLLRERAETSGAGSDDWVFPSTTGGPLQQDNLRRREWARAVREAGVPKRTPHEARHTCASLLLGAGEPALSVSKLLGHEDIATTLRLYGHLIPGAEKKTASRMASLLGSEGG